MAEFMTWTLGLTVGCPEIVCSNPRLKMNGKHAASFNRRPARPHFALRLFAGWITEAFVSSITPVTEKIWSFPKTKHGSVRGDMATAGVYLSGGKVGLSWLFTSVSC